jgi:tetratricopeptide (TPR) repeat protein
MELAQARLTANCTLQNSLDVVFAMTELGNLKRDLDDLPGAQAMLEQAVALGEQMAGPAHPHIAAALAELGLVLMQRDRFDEANATLQRALTMRESVLGPHHKDVSLTLSYMVQLCYRQGNHRRARELLQRCAGANGDINDDFKQVCSTQPPSSRVKHLLF